LARACLAAENQAPATPLPGIFFKECRRLLGQAAFEAGDLAIARASAAWLAEHPESETDRLRAQDFLERVAWRFARR